MKKKSTYHGQLYIFQVALPELTGANYLVTTVNATDRDTGDNAKVIYSMLAVNGFNIDPNTGNNYYLPNINFSILNNKIVTF